MRSAADRAGPSGVPAQARLERIDADGIDAVFAAEVADIEIGLDGECDAEQDGGANAPPRTLLVTEGKRSNHDGLLWTQCFAPSPGPSERSAVTCDRRCMLPMNRTPGARLVPSRSSSALPSRVWTIRRPACHRGRCARGPGALRPVAVPGPKACAAAQAPHEPDRGRSGGMQTHAGILHRHLALEWLLPGFNAFSHNGTRRCLRRSPRRHSCSDGSSGRLERS